MHDHSFSTEFASEAAKGALPVGVTATAAIGAVDWQSWVFILTALYLLMQIGWLGWKIIDKWSGKKVPGDE